MTGRGPHKDQVDAAIREYADQPCEQRPHWMRHPRTESEFGIAGCRTRRRWG